MEDFRTVRIKAMVKVNKSQIFLQGSLVMWNRKIAYSFHTIFQRGNACAANAVAEEIESGDTKLTLVRVDDQPILRQTCEESLQVLVMLFRCVAGYQDIIHVNKDKGELPADLIHKMLEGLCSIPESVRHHVIFIKTKWCYNGSLWDVLLVYRNLIKSLDKVYLGEDCGSTQ